jgi:EAL domain-containing protein (putative c-di-GMP-specific phosphodiesterase class I)
VTDVSNHSDNAHVLSAVLGLASDLGLETVAEGVETEQENKFLIDNGCDILQGYLLSKPLPAAEAGLWMKCHQDGESRAA